MAEGNCCLGYNTSPKVPLRSADEVSNLHTKSLSLRASSSSQIPAAASLIQSLWKCYAADKSFESKATWKIHLREPVQSTNNAWKEVRERESSGYVSRLRELALTSNMYVNTEK